MNKRYIDAITGEKLFENAFIEKYGREAFEASVRGNSIFEDTAYTNMIMFVELYSIERAIARRMDVRASHEEHVALGWAFAKASIELRKMISSEEYYAEDGSICAFVVESGPYIFDGHKVYEEVKP